MGYLKIILYGLLSFIERHPIFTLAVVFLAVFAPVVFKAIGWIIVGVILLVIILASLAALRMYKMRREMENQFRSGAAGGFGGAAGGFSGFGSMQGMSLEELVRRMQEEANARQRAQSSDSSRGETTSTQSSGTQRRVNDKVGDYVDFEEVE